MTASGTGRPGPARLGLLGVVVVALFAALVARLYYLQVLSAPQFEVRAVENQIDEVRIEAPRGRILDRDGRVLAESRMVGEVALDRQVVRRMDPADQDVLFSRLGVVVGMTGEDVRRRWEDPRTHPQAPAVVAADASESTLTYLRERREEFPGVLAHEVPRRVYPYGSLAAHVVGYLGEVPDTELAGADADPGDDAEGGEADRGAYAPGDLYGRAGIEQVFESDLRGVPGSQLLEVDRRSNVVRVLEPIAAERGDDVHLAIDLDVQRTAEQALAQGLLRARELRSRDTGRHFPAPAGAVVVADVRTGELLASASFPNFDPNEFIGGISASFWAQLSAPGAAAPLTNRAVQGRYAPGSTFKLVTAMAGLDAGMIGVSSVFVDNGTYELDPCGGEKCEWSNAADAVYGPITVTEAIQYSSDVYFFDLGARLQRLPDQRDEAIQRTAELFGVGSGTGVQLPFERVGTVPTAESKAALHEAEPEAFPFGRWFVGDNMNLAVGQGQLVMTPLELANVYATFANGGTLHQFNAVRSVTTADGEVVRELGPRVKRQVEIDDDVRDALMAGLVGVTQGFQGTAVAAFTGLAAPWEVAGKTGTAQEFGISAVTKVKKEDTALFVGFAPADDPRWVAAVVLEEGGFGGSSAAPVARAVFEELAAQETSDRSSATGPEVAGTGQPGAVEVSSR